MALVDGLPFWRMESDNEKQDARPFPDAPVVLLMLDPPERPSRGVAMPDALQYLREQGANAWLAIREDYEDNHDCFSAESLLGALKKAGLVPARMPAAVVSNTEPPPATNPAAGIDRVFRVKHRLPLSATALFTGGALPDDFAEPKLEMV